MWPPWLNIHLIAGLEEVLAMLKEQNVIIANMTKETLKDILSRLLMGLEPPLSLSEVPETKIVEGIYVIYVKDISCHFGDGAHRLIAKNIIPPEMLSSMLMLTHEVDQEVLPVARLIETIQCSMLGSKTCA